MHILYVTVHAQLHASHHMLPTPVVAFWERRNIKPPLDGVAECSLYLPANVLPFPSKRGY